MTPAQTKKARRAAENCARAGMPFELAAWMVADWMKKHRIPVSERNLEIAFGQLN